MHEINTFLCLKLTVICQSYLNKVERKRTETLYQKQSKVSSNLGFAANYSFVIYIIPTSTLFSGNSFIIHPRRNFWCFFFTFLQSFSTRISFHGTGNVMGEAVQWQCRKILNEPPPTDTRNLPPYMRQRSLRNLPWPWRAHLSPPRKECIHSAGAWFWYLSPRGHFHITWWGGQ